MKNNLLKIALFFVIIGISSCKGHTDIRIKSITAVTEVYGDGQKTIIAAIEYDKPIKNSDLNDETYKVKDRTITKVYASDTIGKFAEGKDGKFVIIELSINDSIAPTFYQDAGKTFRREAEVVVEQLKEIAAVDGSKVSPTNQYLTSTKQLNLIVDDFIQREYKYSASGETLPYNLFIPKDYDPSKTYPLVLFMHDAGATSTDVKTTLIQGNGATVWATPEEQAKHACFVLAPQYATEIVNDASEATIFLDVTIDLIKDLAKEFRIDENRLYTTGQSGGCMMSIAMNIKYPDFFAASYLVAGQWDPNLVAPMAKDNLWIVVSQGDLKAYPGMNAITQKLEESGAKVSRAVWDGQSTDEQFATDVDKMLAEKANVKYAAFKLGTTVPETLRGKMKQGNEHRGTWRIAYNIVGIRDWLFTQTK